MALTAEAAQLRVCSSCSAANRIPLTHLADVGKCGSCKTELPPLAAPVDVGPSEFDQVVTSAKVPVLVDFWAEWCGPCRMVAPEVAKLATQMAGKAIVLKVDTEKHPDLAQRFAVTGIPNFLVMKDGKQVKQRAGVAMASELARWLA